LKFSVCAKIILLFCVSVRRDVVGSGPSLHHLVESFWPVKIMEREREEENQKSMLQAP